MNPFAQMAAALTAHTAPAWGAVGDEVSKPVRTEMLRQLLRAAQRPVTDFELCEEMVIHFPDFEPNRVWLLLKHDLGKGRVKRRDGRWEYNHAFDTDEHEAIRTAVKLLKRHGYHVAAPIGGR